VGILRFVVDGEETDETSAWGRSMPRNFRCDHLLTDSEEWRYVALVGTEIRYGSADVKNDCPELQQYQNIVMNGGICGRRAWMKWMAFTVATAKLFCLALDYQKLMPLLLIQVSWSCCNIVL
jgi:hypothetical protein